MPKPLPVVLLPGLLCTPRLYLEQLPALWQFGPVTVADHTRDDSMSAIARRILAQAPPRFALIGLSMGGYVAFEIVLNCMNQDGVRKGYDVVQLAAVRAVTQVPLIASGGAGAPEHFKDVFDRARVDGALAASVFHTAAIDIGDLKRYLSGAGIAIRLAA
jgi:pimeloyl-ACP methyl ester carboxylesterase